MQTYLSHGVLASGNDNDIARKPVFVCQHSTATAPEMKAVLGDNIVAGWLCDATGTHSLTADEAKQVEVVSDGVAFNPRVIDFAPLLGSFSAPLSWGTQKAQNEGKDQVSSGPSAPGSAPGAG